MHPDPAHIARLMLAHSSLELEILSCRTIQTLWAGYGVICHLTVRPRTQNTANHLSNIYGKNSAGMNSTYPLILKLISPPSTNSQNEGEGHLRKMLSYQVEQFFYTRIAPDLDTDVPVAKCISSTMDIPKRDPELEGLMGIILADLRPNYPIAGEKRSVLNKNQVFGALTWLAHLHSSWNLSENQEYILPPLEEYSRRRQGDKRSGVWLNGGYTYLATRRSEYDSLKQDTGSEWSERLCTPFYGLGSGSSSIAEMAAAVLTPRGRPCESLIHGDVKSENLFTTEQGEVAFFDFQYVGLGLGVCDLAKLLTCSVPLGMLDDRLSEKMDMGGGERGLLEWYYSTLMRRGERAYDWATFIRHWETALVDWCRFQASWGFWGNTEWLEGRVRWILEDAGWREWLMEQLH